MSLSNAASYKGKYVSSVGYATTSGLITVQLTNAKELGTAAGDTVIYSPIDRGGTLEWIVKGSTPTKYRPKK
ncbi:MAG: hypothetical protein NUV51_10270, partial [Sulfuricaulis sp.]|nr:hypothetical protein [Sulfuricaulis sp.]